MAAHDALAGLAPEARLLLRCAGEADDAAVARALADSLDWDVVVRLAEREGAAPLLWERMVAVDSARVPRAAADRLRRLAQVTRFRMGYLAQRTDDTVRALDAAGVEHALLKGAALAVSAYGAFERRPMIDLDVLVPAARAEAAVTALLADGWGWRADRPRDGDYGHLHHLPALLDARGVALSLEVHTALLPAGQPFGLDPAAVLAGARRTASGARVPDPYVMLLHTCIHFAWGHMLRKGAVRAFRDVRVLLATFELDPEEVAARAAQARAGTACYWTLRLAASLAAVPVPPALLARLRPALPAPALRTLERHFAQVVLPVGADCPSVTLRELLWTAAMQPRASGHGTSRPWRVLGLTPAGRASRQARAAAEGAPARTGRVAAWARYGRAMLAPSAAGR